MQMTQTHCIHLEQHGVKMMGLGIMFDMTIIEAYTGNAGSLTAKLVMVVVELALAEIANKRLLMHGIAAWRSKHETAHNQDH